MADRHRLLPEPGHAEKLEYRGLFDLQVALDGAAVAGNGRLIVISHGSPAPPWVHYDLARTLVEAGYVVALPEHRGDNPKDDSDAGPKSWQRRPHEVSRAIDRVGADPRFLEHLSLDKVGMFGMSAGGHTALTLAGGRWSEAQLRRHCDAHAADDFQACAGPTLQADRQRARSFQDRPVRRVTGWLLADTTWHAYTDPRIAAIVAGVPFAADFDPDSLRRPAVPLGIITVRLDRWLAPAYHGDARPEGLRSVRAPRRPADRRPWRAAVALAPGARRHHRRAHGGPAGLRPRRGAAGDPPANPRVLRPSPGGRRRCTGERSRCQNVETAALNGAFATCTWTCEMLPHPPPLP